MDYLALCFHTEILISHLHGGQFYSNAANASSGLAYSRIFMLIQVCIQVCLRVCVCERERGRMKENRRMSADLRIAKLGGTGRDRPHK